MFIRICSIRKGHSTQVKSIHGLWSQSDLQGLPFSLAGGGPQPVRFWVRSTLETWGETFFTILTSGPAVWLGAG